MSGDAEPRPTLIVLRRAKDRPLADSAYGYTCKICSEPLAASPTGAEALKRPGAIALCNQCGFTLANKMADADRIAGFAVSPRAAGQFEKLGIDLGETERKTLDELHEEIQRREK